MNASEPLIADNFFSEFNASMSDYYIEAKNLSKKHKHYFIGQEHFLGAFLLNKNSIIRKYINQPKWNAKKKVSVLMQQAYPQFKSEPRWWKEYGYFVTPRMQNTWNEAITSTQFNTPIEVYEIHILNALFKSINLPIKNWMESESLYNSKSINIFLTKETELFKQGDANVTPDKEEKTLHVNPFNILNNLFSKKDKNLENATANAELNQANSVELNEQESYEAAAVEIEPTKPPQEEPTEPASTDLHTESNPEPHEEEQNRTLNIGDQYTYSEKELINRGMPQHIFEGFLKLFEQYGPLPERLVYKKKKIYFEELIYSSLTQEEYETVLEDLSSSIKAALARSPFRSSSDAPPQRSLFKAKSQHQEEQAQQTELSRQEEQERQTEPNRQEEQAQQTELNRQEEQARQTELNRQEEQAQQTELNRQEEQAQQTELNRQEEQAQQTELNRQEEQAQQTEPNRQEEQAQQTETNRQEEQAQQTEFNRQEEQAQQTETNRQEEQARQTETNRQEEQERQTEQEEYDSSTKILPKDIRSSETTILRKERQFEKGIKASNEHSKLREAVNKIKFIPGTSSVALYRKFREHTDINAIIQNSNQYLAKTIDTLQEGFHWSEMYETMPGGSAAQNSKTLKPEAEMIKIGAMSKKA